MSEFWTPDTLKAIGGAFVSIALGLGSARAYRQRDRKSQAQSLGDANVTTAEAEGRVSAIESFERLAELANKRAEETEAWSLKSVQRAEAREALSVQRADRAEELMRAALQQASDERLSRQRAESRIEELENRIAELEAKIGNRRSTDA